MTTLLTWNPLTVVAVVGFAAVCLGRLAVAVIDALKGNAAAAQNVIDSMEKAAERGAITAVQHFLADPQWPTPTATNVLTNALIPHTPTITVIDPPSPPSHQTSIDGPPSH